MWTSEVKNKFLLTPQTAINKNIVYEILRECDKRDFICDKKFVTFVVQLVSLQFNDDVNFSEKFDRKIIEELIGICLNIIIGTETEKFPVTLFDILLFCNSHRFKRDANEHNFKDASFLH
jgi:hypothetical protein